MVVTWPFRCWPPQIMHLESPSTSGSIVVVICIEVWREHAIKRATECCAVEDEEGHVTHTWQRTGH